MKRTYKFYLSTKYVGSEVSDDVEIDFDDDATEEEIEAQVEEVWKDWRDQNAEGGWNLIK